jgi:hypothetical protein
MKTISFLIVIAAALIGYFVGRSTRPRPESLDNVHVNEFSLVPAALAQAGEPRVMPFGFNKPGNPPLVPGAPPIIYWNIDDVKRAHIELAEKAARLATQAVSGSAASVGVGPVDVRTRNFSMHMLYRVRRDRPVLSLSKVNSVWDDAERHAGVYDFYVFTGGSGQMIVGAEIGNQKNLMDKDGLGRANIVDNRCLALNQHQSPAIGCLYRRTRPISPRQIVVASAT